MYCPKCGQIQAAEDTRYCSRCGFLLTAIVRIVENGGMPLASAQKPSRNTWRQNRGFRSGLLIFLLTFLIVPILTILTIAANGEPFVVVIATILFGLGGLIKMAWALLFESDKATAEVIAEDAFMPAANQFGSLPEMRSTPANAYVSPAGKWRTTNDLDTPGSVTDPTTKFLSKQTDDQ